MPTSRSYSSSPALVVNAPDMAIPSTWTLIVSRYRRYDTDNYALSSLYKVPGNNFVLRIFSLYQNSMDRKYMTPKILSTTQSADSSFECRDIVLRGPYVCVLCGSLTSGSFVFKCYNCITSIPINPTLVPVDQAFTLALDATCPLDAALFTAKTVDCTFTYNTGSVPYNILMIFNRIPVTEYNPLPPAALQTKSNCAYIVNPKEGKATLFHFPTINPTIFTSNHFITDIAGYSNSAVNFCRIYTWTFNTAESKFNLLSYNVDLDQPTTSTRNPVLVGMGELRLVPVQNFLGMYIFGTTYISYNIGIMTAQTKQAIFTELTLTTGSSDTVLRFAYSSTFYKNRLPTIMCHIDSLYHELEGNLRSFSLYFEEKVGSITYTVHEGYTFGFAQANIPRVTTLFRPGPVRNYFGAMLVSSHIQFIVAESSQLLIFNSSLLRPATNDKSSNLLLDFSTFPASQVQIYPVRYVNQRVAGAFNDTLYDVRFVTANLMWRLEIPTTGISYRASVFTNRWAKLDYPLSGIKGIATSISIAANPSLYKASLLGDTWQRAVYLNESLIELKYGYHVVFTGKFMLVKIKPPLQTNVRVFTCTQTAALDIGELKAYCTKSAEYTNTIMSSATYINHKLFPDDTLIVAYRESSLSVTFYWFQQTSATPNINLDLHSHIGRDSRRQLPLRVSSYPNLAFENPYYHTRE
jgi:hypothetical protein